MFRDHPFIVHDPIILFFLFLLVTCDFKKLSTVEAGSAYQLMMERSQELSLDYEIRKILDLRQAILSYIVFDYSHKRVTDTSKKNGKSLEKPNFDLNQWHSLNCTEPACIPC